MYYYMYYYMYSYTYFYMYYYYIDNEACSLVRISSS
jgi:hypothetical protein